MILITGASGNLGTAVIKDLVKLFSGIRLAGLFRDPKKSKIFTENIDVRIADYSDKKSLINAFKGIEKLLLISSSDNDALQQHKNVIDAAVETGVKHIFYTSGALNCNVVNSKLDSLADSYITTENYIIKSGLAYTIFQNGLYAETIPYFIGYDAVHRGIYFPAGIGKASFIKRADIAEAIANVLGAEGHENKVYLITTQPTYSFNDIARILSELSGTTVSYFSPNPQAYETRLREYGVNEGDIWFSKLFAAIIKNGEYDVDGSDIEQLLGRKPTDLKTYLKETFFD
ncbi:NAD(P)H dehydrogenase (quinone) [Chryseobacterium ginsenosidimutans]|uniref:SDR family oxidoreductase n=1 Tax=Chryseobacterium ginsenosidimutans TaxID=687846 RepID=UPI0027820F0D|nr:SDR family oxidoreductase [Chryseobacterium ginsenosidimutans]MDQ0594808.1 NAD(P)H dehydrogenase (quinone) [Chryseobacterium ginsenosidimutans]